MSDVSGGVEAVITADDAVNSALMKLGQVGEHLRPALAQYLETEHLHAHDVLFIGYPQNDPRFVVEAAVAQKGRKYRELAQQLTLAEAVESKEFAMYIFATSRDLNSEYYSNLVKSPNSMLTDYSSGENLKKSELDALNPRYQFEEGNQR